MMHRQLIALACAMSAAADYVVDWRVPQANDANANAWVADVVVPAGEKVILKPVAVDDLSAFSGPFNGISCRPCN